jgi:hypothetical protein
MPADQSGVLQAPAFTQPTDNFCVLTRLIPEK